MFQALNVVHFNVFKKSATIPQLFKVFELPIANLQKMLSLQLENTNGQFMAFPQV
jgi:hypothetical protein